MAGYGSGTGTTSGNTDTGKKVKPATTPPGPKNPRVFSNNGINKLFGSNAILSEALSELIANSIADNYGVANTLEDKCENLINALGFSIVQNEDEELSPGLESLQEFSLIGSTNQDETIENSKILDPDLNTLTPNKTSATDKFKSESDAFYNADEEKNENIKKDEKRKKFRKRKKNIAIARKLAAASRMSKNKMLNQRANRFRKS